MVLPLKTVSETDKFEILKTYFQTIKRIRSRYLAERVIYTPKLPVRKPVATVSGIGINRVRYGWGRVSMVVEFYR